MNTDTDTSYEIPEIFAKIENLRSLAHMIENERICAIRQLYIQAFGLATKEIARHYKATEPVDNLEEVTPEPTPEKKRRGRKPKAQPETDQAQQAHPEPEEEKEETPVVQAHPEPEPETPTVLDRPEPSPTLGEPEDSSPLDSSPNHDLVFDEECLVENVPRITNLDTITDEYISSSGISPVVLANSCVTEGDHPFYKGVPSFISYLPPERQDFYMAGLFETTEDILEIIDKARIDECEHSGGPNMGFVMSVIDPHTRLPREPHTLPDDQSVIDRLRAGGAMAFIEELGEGPENGKALLRFITRFGFHSDLENDLQCIVRMHNDPETRNPDVRF